jgi:hypothetical protein
VSASANAWAVWPASGRAGGRAGALGGSAAGCAHKPSGRCVWIAARICATFATISLGGSSTLRSAGAMQKAQGRCYALAAGASAAGSTAASDACNAADAAGADDDAAADAAALATALVPRLLRLASYGLHHEQRLPDPRLLAGVMPRCATWLGQATLSHEWHVTESFAIGGSNVAAQAPHRSQALQAALCSKPV